MKKNVLIIGAGAVGAVVAHKCAQSSDVFASVCLASKNIAKCDAIIAAVNRKNHHPHADFSLFSREVNAYNVNDLVDLIRDTGTHIVINVCTAFVNMNILDACLETGTAYIDTAVHEDYSVMNAPYPWYEN